MGFLKKLFSGKAARRDDVDPQPPLSEMGELAAEPMESIVILLEKPLTRQEMRERLTLLPQLLPGVKVVLEDDPQTALVLDLSDASAWGSIHAIALHSENRPLPSEKAQATIHLSNWEESTVKGMYQHAATLTLTHLVGEAGPLDQLVLLYAMATALHPVGVADLTAHNAIPGRFLPDFFTADSLTECRRVVPTMLWTGIIKFQLPDRSVYYASRGFKRFGVKNLAYHGPFGSGEVVTHLFDTLLNYQVASGARLDDGHTSENSTQFMSFSRPDDDYYEALSGGQPVLEVKVSTK